MDLYRLFAVGSNLHAIARNHRNNPVRRYIKGYFTNIYRDGKWSGILDRKGIDLGHSAGRTFDYIHIALAKLRFVDLSGSVRLIMMH